MSRELERAGEPHGSLRAGHRGEDSGRRTHLSTEYEAAADEVERTRAEILAMLAARSNAAATTGQEKSE